MCRDVFSLMREKVDRLFQRPSPAGTTGRSWKADAKALATHPRLSKFAGNVDLVLTSPPYLNVVNYALQNWIRLWFLDEEPKIVDQDLDDHLTLGPWLEFMDAVLEQMYVF